MIRIGLDCTPLLGRRTGIGNYTANLVAELAGIPEVSVVGTAFTLRGRGQLPQLLPAGVDAVARPIPARLLRACWQQLAIPTAEILCGRVDVFHGTNFVLPPTRAAAVVTVHDLAYLRYPHTVSADSLAYHHLVPRALARGAHVITPSHAVAEQVRQAYPISADRVHAIHLGVDPHWATTARPTPAWLAAHQLPREYLLAVGTLEPRKNLAVLLAALRLAKSEGQQLPPLVLVGGQGWGEALDTSGLNEQDLILTGHLPYDDLRQVVAGAMALLFPSVDEGFGLPPVEALACGTAVVAADIPVCREVLGEQVTYVDPRDVAGWAAAAGDAVSAATPSSATSPGPDQQARQDWASQYTWSACARAHTALYQQLA